MDQFVIYGVALTVIALSLAKAIQGEGGLDDKNTNRIRAVLMGLAFLLYTFAPDLEVMYPWFERAVTVGGGLIAVVLGVLGYWNEVQKVGARIKGV